MTARFSFLSLLCAGCLGAISQAAAADLSATARLTETTTSVGNPVELQIEIAGARSVTSAPNIAVDGLTIEFSGRTQQFRSYNLTFQQSVVLQYTVQPDRAGTFTIPAQKIDVGGTTVTTDPITLTVGGSSNAAGAASGQPFAELIVPKSSAYVGEAVPVELRFYFPGRMQPLDPGPRLEAEGVTVAKWGDPKSQRGTRDGVEYSIVTYASSITPVKAGSLAIGPAEMGWVVQIPRRRSTGGHLNLDDLFDDGFGGQISPFAQQKQMNLRCEPVPMEVKPLPKKGQPASFTGAVGKFELSTTAKPARVRGGEPVTLTVTVQGRGNFDRVNVAEPSDLAGWRTYPPSAHFTADDSLNLSGTKAFDFALIPQSKQTVLPQVEFSWFDPVAERYEVRKSDALPVEVEGVAAAPSATPTPALAAAAAASPTPAAKADSGGRPFHAGPTRWGRTFAPWPATAGFWLLQLPPALALAAMLFLGARRRLATDPARERRQRWRDERQSATEILRDSWDEPALVRAATRMLRMDEAEHRGTSPEMIGPDEVLARAEPADRPRLQRLFEADGESRYAGDGSVAATISRAEIVATMQTWKQKYAPR